MNPFRRAFVCNTLVLAVDTVDGIVGIASGNTTIRLTETTGYAGWRLGAMPGGLRTELVEPAAVISNSFHWPTGLDARPDAGASR